MNVNLNFRVTPLGVALAMGVVVLATTFAVTDNPVKRKLKEWYVRRNS